MLKPKSFDTVAASLTFEPLALGGHVCVIKGVEEAKSKAGKDMLKVALDIAEGDPQAGYYADKFANDDRDNKKWPCIAYIVTEDKDGNCSRNLASFVTSVEESNPGFTWNWDERSVAGKMVGMVFGEEEYTANDGTIKTRLTLPRIKSVQDIRDGRYKVPELKKLPASTAAPAAAANDDDVPFFV